MKAKSINNRITTILAGGAIILASAMFTACNNQVNQNGAGQVRTDATDSTGPGNGNMNAQGNAAGSDLSGTGSNNGNNNGNSGNGGTNTPAGPTGKDNGNDTVRRR